MKRSDSLHEPRLFFGTVVSVVGPVTPIVHVDPFGRTFITQLELCIVEVVVNEEKTEWLYDQLNYPEHGEKIRYELFIYNFLRSQRDQWNWTLSIYR